MVRMVVLVSCVTFFGIGAIPVEAQDEWPQWRELLRTDQTELIDEENEVLLRAQNMDPARRGASSGSPCP